MTITTEHTEALRSWAKGVYALEAATELLIRAGRAEPGQPWIRDDGGRAWIEFDVIPESVGMLSGGEQRLLRIAASLGNDIESERTEIPLADELSGLDRPSVALVLAAISHAAGTHEHSDMVVDPETRTGSFAKLGPLYPWPEG